MNIHPVNVFNFCTMLEARNNKPFSSKAVMPILASGGTMWLRGEME